MSESSVMKQVRLEATKYGRFIRVNVGTGWQGRKVTRIMRHGTVTVEPGDVVIKQARPFHAGPPAGTADLLGVTRVTITPDMVGKVIGVATAIETKAAKGKQRDEQKVCERVVKSQGGIYGIAQCAGDVEVLLKQKNLL